MEHLGQKIGIVGGGQLGKMMIQEAKKMGFYVVILDPSGDCPASSICDEQIVEPFNKKDAYLDLASRVDVITYEFEHIDAQILSDLEMEGHRVYPSPSSLKTIQNKQHQKELLVSKGVVTPDFIPVSSADEIREAGNKFGYPLMLKAVTGGYDGKGNSLVRNRDGVENSFKELGSGSIDLIAEKFCPFIKEISVLSCRDQNGNIQVYPVAENIHKNSILDETLVPADIGEEAIERAMKMAHSVMEVFSDVGMFCTEMFVTEDGGILLNEVAPRPHNSGHYTIEGCITSQYENHIRAITGLPLGAPDLIMPSVMKNILGGEKAGPTSVKGVDKVLSHPNVKLHVYGKRESKPGRKMGHITAIAGSLKEAREAAVESYNCIKIEGE